MRYRMTRPMVGLAGTGGVVLAVSILSGCAGFTGRPGNGRLSEAGRVSLTASPMRTDARVDQRAYYAYSRSVWAELQGNLEEAIRWEREALRYDPGSLNLRTHLAWLLLRKGDFRGAIQEGEEVLSLTPDNVQAHLLMAAGYQGLRNAQGAEKHYREVIRLDPRRAEAYMFLGNLYLEARNLPEAIQVFEALAKADPNGYL